MVGHCVVVRGDGREEEYQHGSWYTKESVTVLGKLFKLV
jgi:hypothetical protein